MPNKAKDTYPELNDLRDDLDSLRTNVVELTKHIKENGAAHSQEIKEMAMSRLSEIKASGRAQYKNMERRVKAKPAQSVAIAFAAGLAASLLLGRR